MRYVLSFSRVRYLLCAIAVLLSPADPAAAQSAATLTLDEALRIAEQRSQQLIAQNAAATAARERGIAAGRAPDPTLTVGINNLPVDGPDRYSLTRDFMTMRSIGLSRELTRHDKRDARSARYEREAETEEAGGVLALTNLRRETAVAWLDRYYRERMRALLVSQRDEASLQIDAADLAYRTGLGSQSDAFAARASVAQIEDRIAETDGDVAIATTRLARWIGAEAERPVGDPPRIATLELDAADLDSQLAHHPELALMLKQEELARADADVARTNKRSDWSVELMYSQRGPDFSNMVSINVSKPLQWSERSKQNRELAASLATADRMRAEREEETRAHVADTRALLQNWRSHRQRLDRYTNTLTPLAVARTQAATAAYRGNRGTLGDVLAARSGEIDVRSDQLALEMETARLWAELNYLIPAGHTTSARE